MTQPNHFWTKFEQKIIFGGPNHVSKIEKLTKTLKIRLPKAKSRDQNLGPET